MRRSHLRRLDHALNSIMVLAPTNSHGRRLRKRYGKCEATCSLSWSILTPRAAAIPSGEQDTPTQRDRHLVMIAEQGRLAWQAPTGYGRRSLVETTMGRYKTLIGPRLRARGIAAQQTEAAIGVAVLNRMLVAGRPDSVRRQPVTA
jgi:hypothetical protein